MAIKLHDYQEHGVEDIESHFEDGLDRFLHVMPTGTGKTTVFSYITSLYFKRGKSVLLVAHRTELIEQMHSRLRVAFGINAGIIAANYPVDRSNRVQVASIQTLSNRQHPPADLVIIDECHHARAETYMRLWGLYPKAKILGMTATPCRLNGDGFDDLFEYMGNLYPLKWYFNNNYLTRPKHFNCAYLDVSDVPVRGGEYDRSSLNRVVMGERFRANVIDAYKQHAAGTKTVVFCVDVEHSKKMAEEFKLIGIKAAHLDADTHKDQRKAIMNGFRGNDLELITNVDLVGEGVDVPAIQTVIHARKTKSLALYKQQAGRSFRKSEGKPYGLVLDCVNLWYEHHSYAYDDFKWDLKGNPRPIAEVDVTLEEFLPENLELELPEEMPQLGKNEEGDIIPMDEKLTQKLIGVELIPVDENVKRLVIFESFLDKAKRKNFKLLHSVYEYQKYISTQGEGLSDQEINYCKKRMASLNVPVKEGFWYYLKQGSEVSS